MNPQSIDAIVKGGVGVIAVLGIIFLGNKFLDQLSPILENNGKILERQTELLRVQTEALDSIAKAYTGG